MPSTGGSDPNGGGDSGVGGAASGAGASGAGGSAGNSSGGGYGGSDPSNQGTVNGPGDKGQGYGVTANGMPGFADDGGVGVAEAQAAVSEAKAEAAKNTASKVGKIAGVVAAALGVPAIGATAIGWGAAQIASVVADRSPANISTQLGVDTSTATDISNELEGLSDGEASDILTQAAAAVETGEVDETTSTTENAAQPGSWEHFVNQFFGTSEGQKSALEMYQGQADYMKQQVDQWKATRGAELKGLEDANTKSTGLLDDLIDQSKSGTGLFSPVSFTLAGQQIEFVPRALREQAAQEALMVQQQYTNANTLYTNQADAADDTLTNMAAVSPHTASLGYLDSLGTMSSTGAGIDYADRALEQAGNIAGDQLEANEPGFLDTLKGIGTGLETANEIYNIFA